MIVVFPEYFHLHFIIPFINILQYVIAWFLTAVRLEVRQWCKTTRVSNTMSFVRFCEALVTSIRRKFALIYFDTYCKLNNSLAIVLINIIILRRSTLICYCTKSNSCLLLG